MFRLKTPISRADRKDEFDSVATILSQSLITRPSHIKGLPGWLSSIGDDGGIFHLELPAGVETKLVRLSSGDGGSVSSLALGVGCNSEDTGYSSDQDLNSPDIHNSNIHKQEKRTNLLSNEINSSHCVKLFRTSRAPSSAQQESESICGRKSQTFKTTNTGQVSSTNLDSSHIYSCLDEGNDDGVFLNKSDLRSSKTSTISTNSSGSHCSHASCANNSSCNHQVLYKSDFQKNGGSGRCVFNSSCSKKYGSCLDWKTVNVEVKLNPFKFRNTSQSSFCNSEGILCEQLLGIVPTYKDDNSRTSCSDVIVKGLLPDCDVALRRQATLGTWLHSINGQELTWYNMDTLLSSLSKLKKVKLTLKSLKPENSTVDLEALVNILTTDTQDHHGLDNMAAMYISLDGVNPDDPSNTNVRT
ncbi:unnamed protein product [Lymnaea stagnalis]|uniref:PDZ domain-containing protein n=1 Tax=Lymnaea stagnalis TaxID=6523 RepID=A0AAV2HAU3_LYMST